MRRRHDPGVMRAAFDEIADQYDGWFAEPAGARYDRLEKDAVAEVLPPPAGYPRLLDVGAGTGHWSEFFDRLGFEVVGLDLSARMLGVARAKHIPTARWLLADAKDIPFADACFDVAAAITTLEFTGAVDRVLDEMARCTRPGGRLIVGALNRHSVLGLRRRWKRTALFASAEMLTVGRVREYLSRYGEPRVRSVGFLWPPLVAPLIEQARLPWGDFIVGACRLR